MFEPKLFLPDDYDKHVSGWFKIYLFSFQVSDDCVIASDLDWWLLRTRYVGWTDGLQMVIYIYFFDFILLFIFFEWMCRCRVVHNVGVWLLIRFDVCRSEIVICGRGRLCSLRAIGERLEFSLWTSNLTLCCLVKERLCVLGDAVWWHFSL